MDTKQVGAYFEAVKSQSIDYQSGYRRGLTWHLKRLRCKSNVATPNHHKWNEYWGVLQDLGDGYRDGFAGKPPRGFEECAAG